MDIGQREEGSNFVLMRFEAKYLTPEGHYIADEAYVEFSWSPGTAGVDPAESYYQGKRYWQSEHMYLKALDDE